MRNLFLALTLVGLVGCGDSSTSNADAGSSGNADATAIRPDATTTHPDAAMTIPDAAMSNPDATTTNPDATTANPDAAMSNPDAAMSNPDAAVFPDAGVLPSNCTGTLSGALTGTFSCSVQAAFASMDGESGFAISGLNLPANIIVIAVGGSITGQLSVKTYNTSDFIDVGASIATNTGSYVMDTVTPVGTTQVVLTSVAVATQVGNDIAYTVHGTATITLVASGGTNTVTMSVTF